jgi:KaiC/GvpD/RAD55 family RecA-like ATPase
MFESFTESEIASFYRVRVPGLKKVGREWRGPCPVHSGKDPNFGVDPATGQWFCFSRCGRGGGLIDLEMELRRLEFVPAKLEVFRIIGRPEPDFQELAFEATYDYTDANGKLLYQVVRKPGKTFMQRRRLNGQWSWALGDTPRVPFRLPELLACNTVVAVCYAADTEILTARGWVPFSELTSVDTVAQYGEGSVSFVSPKAIQEFEYSGDMVNFSADWCDMMVTPDHRVLSRLRKSGRYKGFCKPVVNRAGDIHSGSHRYYPTAGILERESEIDGGPTVEQARLAAAWCADGINEKRGFKISWNLKKSRKKQRLEELLKAVEVEFSAHIYNSCLEWTHYRVCRNTVSWLDEFCPDKKIPLSAMYWSRESREAFLKELGHWDGDFSGPAGIRLFTANWCEAEAVAAIAAVTGFSSITRADNRESRPEQKTQYVVNLTEKPWRTMMQPPQRVGYTGSVYCCTVPSGFIVTRRNGKTTISGNCEGEKDALNLTRAGWVATCNSGGGCNFKAELVPHFAGKHVAIFPDNDDKGRQHADLVARLLSPVAASLKIVVIPDLPEKGDVSDFLARGGTGLDLRQMYREAPDWTPDLKPETLAVHENDRYLRTFADELRAAGGFEGFWKSLDVEGIPTPFPALTRKLGGMRKGEVYILAARTGQGKTSLVLQFADAALISRTGVLLFSMEMGHRDAFQRLAAQRARVDLSHFRYLRRTGPDSPLLYEMTMALRESTEIYAQSPLFVSTKSAVTPEFLHVESMRVRERSQVGLVVVDHMQLMGGDPRARSEYEKFTAISRITKQIAVDLDVPLILVSQVNRSNAERKGTELEMTDLRSSGALEEDAAVVMLLYYDNADWKEAGRDPTGERMKRGPIDSWLKLAKNRYGCSGTYEKLVHMKSITRFDVSSERGLQAAAARA